MATDQAGFLARLRSQLTRGWFPNPAPVLDGILSGAAASASYIDSFLDYARLQTRITTATDGFLDLIANDYFGLRLRRRTLESDAAYSARIKRELLRPRATRPAIVQVLTDLTGTAPKVFEPWRPADCGGYGIAPSMGYGLAGRWGSSILTAQVVIDAYRPLGAGIPNAPGWGSSQWGYGVADKYSSTSEITGLVTDADILAAAESVRPDGVTFWLGISNAPPLDGALIGSLGERFILDSSALA